MGKALYAKEAQAVRDKLDSRISNKQKPPRLEGAYLAYI